jgi:hypothetical protein
MFESYRGRAIATIKAKYPSTNTPPAIGGAFHSVFGRNCNCGCLIGNGNAEDSTPICNGHRGAGDPDFGALFCFRPGPFPTCHQRISQCDAGRALVWLNVWRLHRGFFPCPRIYLRGRKKASKACLGLGDCRFPHTQFHWIHPLLSVPRPSPWALQLLWQAYSRGRSILQPLRILAGFSVSNASQLTTTQNGERYET